MQPRGFDDPLGVIPIDGKGVGMAAASIQGQHQASAQPFMSGIFEHECFEFTDDVGVADLEIDVDASCQCAQPCSVEPHDLQARPTAVVELLVRLSSPQRQRLPKPLAPSPSVVAFNEAPALISQVREHGGVDPEPIPW